MLLQPSFNPASSPYITDNAGKPLDKNPLLLDVRVRQALNLAINRKAIADRILGAPPPRQPVDAQGHLRLQPDIKDIPNDVAQPEAAGRRAFPTASS